MKVVALWDKNYRVTVNARQFSIQTDESLEFSGEDTGMMPTEMFLCSLASCFCMAIVYASSKIRIELKDLNVEVIGDKELKNFYFTKCTVKVKSSTTSEKLNRAVELAKKFCFVTNTIKRSTPIEYVIN